jgi:hypothetical protein
MQGITFLKKRDDSRVFEGKCRFYDVRMERKRD